MPARPVPHRAATRSAKRVGAPFFFSLSSPLASSSTARACRHLCHSRTFPSTYCASSAPSAASRAARFNGRPYNGRPCVSTTTAQYLPSTRVPCLVDAILDRACVQVCAAASASLSVPRPDPSSRGRNSSTRPIAAAKSECMLKHACFARPSRCQRSGHPASYHLYNPFRFVSLVDSSAHTPTPCRSHRLPTVSRTTRHGADAHRIAFIPAVFACQGRHLQFVSPTACRPTPTPLHPDRSALTARPRPSAALHRAPAALHRGSDGCMLRCHAGPCRFDGV